MSFPYHPKRVSIKLYHTADCGSNCTKIVASYVTSARDPYYKVEARLIVAYITQCVFFYLRWLFIPMQVQHKYCECRNFRAVHIFALFAFLTCL